MANNTDKKELNRELGIDTIPELEEIKGDIDYETAVMLLKLDKNNNNPINGKLISLTEDYKRLEEKAIKKVLISVLTKGKKLEKAVLNELEKNQILWELANNSEIKKEIKDSLLKGDITIDQLKNNLEKMGLTDEEFKQFINGLVYLPEEPNIFKLEELQNIYRRQVQIEVGNLIKQGKKIDAKQLDLIKNRVFTQVVNLKFGTNIVEKILIPTYGDLDTARKIFENLSNKISAFDKQAQEQAGNPWEKFKKLGLLGTISYYIDQSSMNSSHKEAAKLISQLAVGIGLLVGLWKMITSDCLIKSDKGCKLRGGFLRSILFLGIGEFAYNWATKGKHSLPDLLGAILTGGLDSSYNPFSNDKNEKNVISNTIGGDLEKSKYMLELKEQVTDPLLLRILFEGETIGDIKKANFYNNGDIDLQKLLEYFKNKSNKDKKYVFSYLLVKGILDSNSSRKKKLLKDSIKNGLSMLENYGNNRKVEDIYQNEYLKRYKEIAEIKDKIKKIRDPYIKSLYKNVEDKINSLLRDYLCGKIKAIDDLKQRLRAITYKNQSLGNTVDKYLFKNSNSNSNFSLANNSSSKYSNAPTSANPNILIN